MSISVISEYHEEHFAICEDARGRFVLTAENPEPQPLEYIPQRCALTTPRVEQRVH